MGLGALASSSDCAKPPLATDLPPYTLKVGWRDAALQVCASPVPESYTGRSKQLTAP